MLAVHFGAGNIGRGFIGALLYQSDYHTTFVDVNKAVIDEINAKKTYSVILADESKKEMQIENISGINSIENPEEVIQSIVDADIVTTAVGPNILPIIADLVAKGLKARHVAHQKPLNIIACENMIGGSALLKEKVFALLSDNEKNTFENIYAFPNAAVDRIVPNQKNEDLLTVSVEPYYEWVVEEKDIIGDNPPIDGIKYVKDLTPYIERKLFTVNTGDAVAAYIGNFLGLTTIKEAMDTKTVRELVQGSLQESGKALVKKYGFNEEEHADYIETIIQRFLNPNISDEVTRVARGPLRKLGKNDRLIKPATSFMDVIGEEPIYLAKAIAATLNYENKEDVEAVELQQKISEHGYAKTLQIVAELEENHPLIELVEEQLEEIKNLQK